jgi:diguanylate cyclase (GGDEF)-like protein
LNYALFDFFFDAVLVVDGEGRIQYANESFLRLFDLSERLIRLNEIAVNHIEIPEECWTPVTDKSGFYREVGFVSRSGVMGRAQVYTGFTPNGHTYLIIRDVTVEVRLQAKYQVQLQSNEKIASETQRIVSAAAILRMITGQIPEYCDKTSALNLLIERLKSEFGFTEGYIVQEREPSVQQEDQKVRFEAVGLQKQLDHRGRLILARMEHELEMIQAGQQVRAITVTNQGVIWAIAVRPRLEKMAVVLAFSPVVPATADMHSFFEILSVDVALKIDNYQLYFGSMIDPDIGIYNKRFFDARLQLECRQGQERKLSLGLMLIQVDEMDAAPSPSSRALAKADADVVLAVIAQTIRRRVRASDFLARFEKNQIAVVLPGTKPEGSVNLAESLMKMFSELKIPLSTGAVLQPRIHCGVTGYDWAVEASGEMTPVLCAAATEAVKIAASQKDSRIHFRPSTAI